MPYYESPSLYIDFSLLPPPQVIEEIDYESLLAIYQGQVLAKNPALAAALKLQQSPANVILQAQAYGDMMVRARVNAAARAVMLPFATGGDLDVLAAFYNVQRLTLADGTSELDAAFRRRVQISMESFSTAGSAGSYTYHGLSSDGTIRDVSAKKVDDKGGVKVTVMNSGNDPTPTDAQLANVRAVLFSKNIKPLTDNLTISAPTIFQTAILAEIILYPGPDSALVLSNIQGALNTLRTRIRALGVSLTRSALITAISQEGVEDVNLITPAADILCDDDQCVQLTGATINTLATRRL